VVNKQQPDKPHGHDVPNAWPFPVFPPKAWTPQQVEEYNKQQRQQVPDAPM
jgi:hypothetical protein